MGVSPQETQLSFWMFRSTTEGRGDFGTCLTARRVPDLRPPTPLVRRGVGAPGFEPGILTDVVSALSYQRHAPDEKNDLY